MCASCCRCWRWRSSLWTSSCRAFATAASRTLRALRCSVRDAAERARGCNGGRTGSSRLLFYECAAAWSCCCCCGFLPSPSIVSACSAGANMPLPCACSMCVCVPVCRYACLTAEGPRSLTFRPSVPSMLSLHSVLLVFFSRAMPLCPCCGWAWCETNK